MANDWKDCSLGDVIELKLGYDLPQKERLPGYVPLVSSSGFTDTHAKVMSKYPPAKPGALVREPLKAAKGSLTGPQG